MADRTITWSKIALKQFSQAINYIEADSPQNAEKVRYDIIMKIQRLANSPEIYSLDKYKLNNDGNYRAFELYRYRIAYKVTTQKIIIARIRHTSREPKLY